MSGRRPAGMPRRQGARLFAAWLGLHALLLQILLPALHHPEHLFASRGALAAALVALAQAVPILPLQHHGDVGDGKTPPSCPLCLSIQHGPSFLPPAAPALPPPVARDKGLAAALPTAALPWTNFAARARAPPLA